MSEPERAAASTTSTPRDRPDISRLRRGKLCGAGGVPGREFADERARRRDLVREPRMSGRIHAVEARAADRDRDAARRERAAVRGGVDARGEPARDRESVALRGARRNRRRFRSRRPWPARLPTIATCGRDRRAGSPRTKRAAGMPRHRRQLHRVAGVVRGEELRPGRASHSRSRPIPAASVSPGHRSRSSQPMRSSRVSRAPIP